MTHRSLTSENVMLVVHHRSQRNFVSKALTKDINVVPYLTKNINALEKVQWFAARVVLGTWDLSSDQLLIRAGLPTQAARKRYIYNNAAFFKLFMAILLFLMVMWLLDLSPLKWHFGPLDALYISANPLLGRTCISIHSSQVQSPTGTHYLLT